MRYFITLVLSFSLLACSGSPEKSDGKPTGTTVAKTEKPKPKPPDISKEARAAFLDAIASYRAQKKTGNFDYQSLLAEFEAALEKDPKLAEAHYNIGCIYEALRKDKKAQEHYKKALQIRGDLAPAAANWGSLLARKGKLDQALLVYKRALSKESKNSAVMLNMASIYHQQKKYDAALKTASDVLIRDPSNVGAYRIMASVYYDKKDLDMAHLICLRGLTVKDKDPRLLNTLGLVLLELKKVPEALAQFRKALQQVPDMIGTRFNVAKIALDYRDFRVAKQEFDRILQYDPENKKAAVGLGIALKGAGDIDAAWNHFEALTNRYPKLPISYFWLAELALRQKNDPRQSIKFYKKFIDLAGSRLPSDHRAFTGIKEAKQTIAMNKKMKEMERKAMAEAKRQAELEKKLADKRAKLFEDAWAKAETEGGVLPPAKLNARELPFILLPPAISPAERNKVKLFGMEFKDIKKVEIGNIKVKFKQKDKYTLVILIPKWLGLRSKDVYGPWDVMITYKDKHTDPIIFQGGLWVGKKPKKKPKPEKKDEKAEKTKETSGKKGKKKEPPDAKAVKDKKAAGADKAGPEGTKPAGSKGKPGDAKEADEPKEPGEPTEPGEPKGP